MIKSMCFFSFIIYDTFIVLKFVMLLKFCFVTTVWCCVGYFCKTVMKTLLILNLFKLIQHVCSFGKRIRLGA